MGIFIGNFLLPVLIVVMVGIIEARYYTPRYSRYK